MRLYDRLKMNNWTLFGHAIKPVIDASAIAEQIDALPSTANGIGWSSREYGVVAPPWARPFFIEAATRVDTQLVQRGVICWSFDRDDPEHAPWFERLNVPLQARWAICLEGFLHTQGQTYGYDGFACVAVASDGTLITAMDQPIPVITLKPKTYIQVAYTAILPCMAQDVAHHAVYALKALAALNRSCPVDHETPSRQQRRRIERETGVPATDYYVLQVRPMKRGRFEEVALKPMQSGTAYHSVRGHFKTYRSKPRFGRDDGYGTFWIAEHSRGDSTIGTIEKDYQVE